MEPRSTERKAQDYTAMGHSVNLINAVIAGTELEDKEAIDRQECVDRNVGHLEIMVAKTDWGSEDMTSVNAAITSGKAYIAS